MQKNIFKATIIINALLSSKSFAKNEDSSVVKSVSEGGRGKVSVRYREPLESSATSAADYILSHKEVYLALAVLLSLIILVLLEVKIIKERNIGEEATIRLLIVTLVIVGSLFVIMAGYTDTQIAPIFALFGTICGYLFGKRDGTKNDNQSS
ncbi:MULTISPECIES: hypothetical protein [Olivibacter]|uniref:Uncharacterized protein n=1 Tax=Olivibacter jilunii TaxID=985016 RepID=A0ABW6B657_9SPHI